MKQPRIPGTLRSGQKPRHSYEEPPTEAPAGYEGRVKNAYRCDTCGGYVVTIDRVHGTTPMFLACRVDGDPLAPGFDGCKGQMSSMGYPSEPWPIDATPTWEWFRPTEADLKGATAAMLEHVGLGGLEIRKIAGIEAVS